MHPTTHYIWRTAGDDRVRPSHAANEGRIFAWASPPSTGHPGEEVNCRCEAVPYGGVSPEPGIESSYLGSVALTLLALLALRFPYLAIIWRLWMLRRAASENWKLSESKSPQKWANQITQGNWTPEKITHVIKNGVPHAALNKATKGPATRYQLGDKFVVRDNKTGEILQVSRPGMKPEVFNPIGE